METRLCMDQSGQITGWYENEHMIVMDEIGMFGVGTSVVILCICR
jgi:hypothetical protein